MACTVFWALLRLNRFNDRPECAFDPSSLNFAIHIRMGDRRQFQEVDLDYFSLLEIFMDTVAAGKFCLRVLMQNRLSGRLRGANKQVLERDFLCTGYDYSVFDRSHP